MAREHLSRYPFHLNSATWVYEEPAGLEIFHLNSATWVYEEPAGLEIFNATGRVGVIPWEKVRAALARRDKPKPKKGGKR